VQTWLLKAPAVPAGFERVVQAYEQSESFGGPTIKRIVRLHHLSMEMDDELGQWPLWWPRLLVVTAHPDASLVINLLVETKNNTNIWLWDVRLRLKVLMAKG